MFCDLDDTLFEPHAFSVDASARRALNRLEREQLPLVFCSSKTRAEIELIQQELGINHPFVCENGAAVFVPRGYFAFGVAEAIDVSGYDTWSNSASRTQRSSPCCIVRRTGSESSVVGFSDMSVGDVAIDCDVPLLQARLAKLREYSELFRVVDCQARSNPPTVQGAARSRSRLHESWTLSPCRSAATTTSAVSFFAACTVEPLVQVVTVAFGDHRSAAPLLRHADVPLVVQIRRR